MGSGTAPGVAVAATVWFTNRSWPCAPSENMRPGPETGVQLAGVAPCPHCTPITSQAEAFCPLSSGGKPRPAPTQNTLLQQSARAWGPLLSLLAGGGASRALMLLLCPLRPDLR